MATQPGRTVLRPVEPPRPLKSTLKQQQQSHVLSATYEVQSIEELITLMENVAATLASGHCSADSMNALSSNLRSLGMQLELAAKDTLDRAFVSFRNASQDERLSIMTRLNLLELIELRAKGWQVSEDTNSYYKHKASYVEPDTTSTELSTSPQGMHPAGITSLLPNAFLAPGEIIRNSGKFSKPTKIPGKNYSKDEVVIRNADSGKVMGIKGRRVHMIEELSETIISFQRVNPGAKERLVQITGPSEDKINYAKQLIEDTIRRNASPVRLESHEEDGCSSLASSVSDEAPRHRIVPQNIIGGGGGSSGNVGGGHAKYHRNPQTLLHSFSTNDASLGEYKFTVTVGGSAIKITGDSLELVRAAKLVLEDHFSSTEFVIEPGNYHGGSAADASNYAGSDYSLHHQNVPSMVPGSHQLVTTGSPMVDSGIALDKIASSRGGGIRYTKQKSEGDGDDDVFIVEENGSLVSVNAMKTSNNNNNNVTSGGSGLNRSRKTNFSRKSLSPENALDRASLKQEISHENKIKMTYQITELLDMAKAKSAAALPHDWIKICEKWPTLVRNKVGDAVNNNYYATSSTNKFSRTKLYRHKSFDASTNHRSYGHESDNNNVTNNNEESVPGPTARPRFVRCFSTNNQS